MSVSRMVETEFLHEITWDDFFQNHLGSVLVFEYGALVSFHYLVGKQVVKGYSNACLGIALILSVPFPLILTSFPQLTRFICPTCLPWSSWFVFSEEPEMRPSKVFLLFSVHLSCLPSPSFPFLGSHMPSCQQQKHLFPGRIATLSYLE